MKSRFLAQAGLVSVLAGSALAAPPDKSRSWPGDDVPLPLPVKTPHDLRVKTVVERQYLIFNLLASGKVAWDAADYATAAGKWDSLLGMSGLDPEIDATIRPLAREARARAGGRSATPLTPQPPAKATSVTPPRDARSESHGDRVTISGEVSGGSGGAVIWLKRADLDTPRPKPIVASIAQRNKTFDPPLLVVPVGSKVEFPNRDDIYHNVFSVAHPNEFDAGLYKAPNAYTRTFKQAGMVQLLCNIHAAMLGYIYVVDTPWYAQTDARGKFIIRGIPPGEYDIEAWSPGSATTARRRLTIGSAGLNSVSLILAGDGRPLGFVPDKFGRPRRVQY